MGRFARVVVPGLPHHVTQRGNRRADVFLDKADRNLYLGLLGERAERYGVEVWAYCLMSNHIHLIAVPKTEISLAKTLRDTHTIYAMRFNRKYEEIGHLWQARYYSCVLGERHLWAAVHYVESNPVRAGLVKRAEDFEWSSAPAHCGSRKHPVLSEAFPPADWSGNWSKWLADDPSPDFVQDVRKRTSTGRPCGSAEFVQQLEEQLGRCLRPMKRGRKPKRKRKKGGGETNS